MIGNFAFLGDPAGNVKITLVEYYAPMCGICGKLSFDASEPVDANLTQRMCDVIAHRGPDDWGVYTDRRVSLGVRRLAIIDLSPAGHQPMANEDETIWIVFNGEIYNFCELRRVLERKGHLFISSSDTEVILHLYEEYGPECVRHLRGMFAFAIWDTNRQRLCLARDRVGQKPLVYAVVNNSLIFASELKAILQDPCVPREVNLEAIQHYLTYGYVPSPLTAFKGIMKLLPAHILVWQRGNLRNERYWNLRYTPKTTLSEGECEERILELLRAATRLRLVSDVPLGAFLSGGLDSSSVVAMMSQVTNEPVKTYSIGFEEEGFNELCYARLAAEKFGTDHHEFVIKPDALNVLPRLIWHYNEPFADPSAIPTYYISQITREHVTVALNGDGGDESFAGYPRYVQCRQIDRVADSLSMLPNGARRAVQNMLGRLSPESVSRSMMLRRLQWILETADSTPSQRYGRFVTKFHPEIKRQLCTDDFVRAVAHSNPARLLLECYNRAGARDDIDKMLYVDVMTYLPDDLMVKADIASMAVSLEVRSPYLDHHLMEFAARLPAHYKLRGNTTKYILKRAVAEVLPAEVLHRTKKGFSVPIRRWLRRELKDYAYDVLLDNVAKQRGYFRAVYVRALLDDHVSGRGDHSTRIWVLLNLELWHRVFVDQIPPDTPP